MNERKVVYMFSKIKHEFDMKGKRAVALLIATALSYGLTGCSKNETSAPTSSGQNVSQSISQSGIESISEQTSFDIEIVRKSLIVKDVPFELPKRIGDLDDAWTYKKRETHYVDNTGLADFYYNGKEMFVAGIGDFKEGKEDDGFIYDIALESDDCSIGGITPNISTKDDVVKKYGNPEKINTYEERGLYRYIYGTQDSDQELFKIEHSQMFTVVFSAENDVVQGVRVVSHTFRD